MAYPPDPVVISCAGPRLQAEEAAAVIWLVEDHLAQGRFRICLDLTLVEELPETVLEGWKNPIASGRAHGLMIVAAAPQQAEYLGRLETVLPVYESIRAALVCFR